MSTITPKQRIAVIKAGDEPVELVDPLTGVSYLLVRADVYRRMQELIAEDESRREQEAWSRLARKGRDQWGEENPY